MASATVYSKNGKKVGTVEMNPAVFEAKINTRLLDLVGRLYANNKRTGTAHTKTRAEKRGGGAKPWRQKGTGRARVSSIRSPLWRGGAPIFGPRYREIYYTIPKEIRKKALISALSKKFREKRIVILDELSLSSHKTKELYTILEKLKINESNTLLVAHNGSDKLTKASRNIPTLSLKHVRDMNAYHIVRKQILLCDKNAVKAIEERILS